MTKKRKDDKKNLVTRNNSKGSKGTKKNPSTKKDRDGRKNKNSKKGQVTKARKRDTGKSKATSRPKRHALHDASGSPSADSRTPGCMGGTGRRRDRGQASRDAHTSGTCGAPVPDDFPMVQFHNDLICHMAHVGNIIELSCHHLRRSLESGWLSDMWPISVPIAPMAISGIPIPSLWG